MRSRKSFRRESVTAAIGRYGRGDTGTEYGRAIRFIPRRETVPNIVVGPAGRPARVYLLSTRRTMMNDGAGPRRRFVHGVAAGKDGVAVKRNTVAPPEYT